jgi:uncharacterized protein YbjT (DUF2867 family)
MRVAVVGATGLTGRPTVAALQAGGHEPVPIARSTGVDVVTGAGLDAALTGVDAVIDVVNTASFDPNVVAQFFGTATAHLLAAEARAGVGHHVLLSIVGIDRIDGNAHYAGKRRQEELVEAGPVPWTIRRATQFFEFAGMVAGWTRRDGVSTVPPLLVQPVAVADVAAVLVEDATAAPRGRAPDLAGPEPQDLVDMARRTLAVRGDSTRLLASWRGPLTDELAGEVLLPGPGARLASTTFDAWLAGGAGS